MPAQIYVGNLTYSMTEDSLRELFEPFGEVTSTKIIKDRLTDRSRGFGFVEMENKDEAETAIQKIDGTEVEGRNMKVNLARPRRE
ncbi:MAG: RNA-binding protein [Candidatus Aminicenantes bacterium]|nr:RNA-binding protein [Candidatus Aminicenantes bacterium]